MKKTILLLEDDMRLEKEGFRVLSAFTASGAEDLFEKNEVHLIISDINLSEGSGLDFCRKIREKSNVYIIFLTALDQEIDIVTGYDMGADDYITKPFSLMVLVSKVHALMKRVGTEKTSTLKCSDIRESLERRRASVTQQKRTAAFDLLSGKSPADFFKGTDCGGGMGY